MPHSTGKRHHRGSRIAPTPATRLRVHRRLYHLDFPWSTPVFANIRRRDMDVRGLFPEERAIKRCILEPSQLVSALEAVAARLGIPIRYDVMNRGLARWRGRPSGGLCRLRGRPLILLDAELGPRDHMVTLATALATFDLDRFYLPPLVRATILAHGRTRLLEPRPLARVRPRRS